MGITVTSAIENNSFGDEWNRCIENADKKSSYMLWI